MNVIAALLWLLPITAWAAPYDDCILQNMKGVQAQNAANAIARACREKTTPKKCRYNALQVRASNMPPWEKYEIAATHGVPNQVTGYEFDAYLAAACLKECAGANYYSRKFGECSTDW